jgi:dihydroflavonol-4-reductase
MTVVVTGASGHVGPNLVSELIARGESVRVLVHRNGASLSALGVEQVTGSVTDPQSLAAAFEGATRVYHLACVIALGKDPERVWQVNAEGTANVVRACREAGVGRLVHVSSIGVFEQRPIDRPLDETRPQVTDATNRVVYNLSKAKAEQTIRAQVDQGLDAVIVNPTAIMGHVDHGPSLLGQMLLDLAARKLPALLDAGFDFVDVRDVVAGILAAGDRGQKGANYLLGGSWHSMKEMAEVASTVTGVPAPRMVTPVWVARMSVPIATLFAKLGNKEPELTPEAIDVLSTNRLVSSDKAKRELGYAPRPFAESVRDAYRWLAAHGKLDPEISKRVLAQA